MSVRFTKEIQCLSRLDELTGVFPEIYQFLLDERVVQKSHIDKIKSSHLKAKELQQLLTLLKEEDKFQMLEYSWTVLPAEIIVVTIVTDSAKREFSYTAF